MSQSQEQLAKARKKTLSSATAFVEDMEHIRALLHENHEISRGDIRRLSAFLRRLLIDNEGDLRPIAPPRTGKLHISAPNNLPYIRAAGDEGYLFFGSGGPAMRGVTIRSVAYMSKLPKNYREKMKGVNPGDTIELSMDGFLKQPVLCHNGRWMRRIDVIKYVANIISGVHSNPSKTSTELALDAVRNVMRYRSDGGLLFQTELVTGRPIPEMKYDQNSIDPVLWEVLSAAFFLANSKDISLLESFIRSELGIIDPRPSA